MLQNKPQIYDTVKILPKTKILPLLAGTVLLTSHASRADHVIADDVIVQSSIAAGIDAADGMGFGFDTFVLKENNLRIFFDDTSTSGGGYPSNDWRLLANDSDLGGTNFFAIEDATAGTRPFYIKAGAGNRVLTVDSGKVDVGGRLALTGTSSGNNIQVTAGDTPGLRLEQKNIEGYTYTPQTWDVGGNEANFFIRDITGGSRLCFRIRPGAPTSSIDINSSGFVGVGTASPKAKMHLFTSEGQGLLIGNYDSNPALTTNAAMLHVDGNALIATRLGIGSTNTVAKSQALYVEGTAFISQTLEIGSSRTRKENIREVSLEEAQATLKELTPVQFNYKGDGEQQLGFIAEDVPDAVSTQSRKSLVPMDFVAVLTKVVQEHQRRETELQQTVQLQQELLQALAQRLSSMEERLNAHSKNASVQQ